MKDATIDLQELPLDWHQEANGQCWRADGMRVLKRKNPSHDKPFYIVLAGNNFMKDRNNRHIRYFATQLTAMNAANKALPLGEWTEKTALLRIRSDGAMVRRTDEETAWEAFAPNGDRIAAELFESAEAAMRDTDRLVPCMGIEHHPNKRWREVHPLEWKRRDGARAVRVDGIWYCYTPAGFALDSRVQDALDDREIGYAYASTAMRKVNTAHPFTNTFFIDVMTTYRGKSLWTEDGPNCSRRLDGATVRQHQDYAEIWLAITRDGVTLEHHNGDDRPFASSGRAMDVLDIEHPINPWKQDNDILCVRFDGATVLETDGGWIANGPTSAHGEPLRDGDGNPVMFENADEAMLAVDTKHVMGAQEPTEADTLSEHDKPTSPLDTWQTADGTTLSSDDLSGRPMPRALRVLLGDHSTSDGPELPQHWLPMHETLLVRDDGGCVLQQPGTIFWLAYPRITDSHDPHAFDIGDDGPILTDEAEPLTDGDEPATFDDALAAITALDERHPYLPENDLSSQRWQFMHKGVYARLDGAMVSVEEEMDNGWVIIKPFDNSIGPLKPEMLLDGNGQVYVFEHPAEAMEAADELLPLDENAANLTLPDLIEMAGYRAPIVDEHDRPLFAVKDDERTLVVIGVPGQSKAIVTDDEINLDTETAERRTDEADYKEPFHYSWLWPPKETFYADPPSGSVYIKREEIMQPARVPGEDGWSRGQVTVFDVKIRSETHYLKVSFKGPTNPGSTIKIEKTQPIIFRLWILQFARRIGATTKLKRLDWQWPQWCLSWLTGSTKITLSTPGTEDLH